MEGRNGNVYPRGRINCSVCGKEFDTDENTKCIIAGGYTCDWKCFFNESKKRELERKENKDKKIKK